MSHLTMSQFANRLDFEQAQATHAGKQLVRYTPDEHDYIRVGDRAIVTPIDHPDTIRVTNTKPVFTSAVVSYNEETGVFVTRNTRYVPDSLVAAATRAPA